MSRNYVFIRDALMNGSLSYARLHGVTRSHGVLANVNSEGVAAALSGQRIKL
jgi:hypothetical protein